MRAVFLAFGTAGDVLPLLALAVRLSQECTPAARVCLVTHDAHQELVAEAAERHGLQLRLVPTPPGRTWDGDSSGSVPSPKRQRAGDGCAGQRSLFDTILEQQQREASIAACEQAFGRALPTSCIEQPQPLTSGGLPPTAPAAVPHPHAAAQGAESGGGQAVVFNLFALEGFHIAEALGVPCVAASPCLPPSTMPAALERALRREQPALCRLLGAAQKGGDADGERCVSWTEVRHWLWPLFTERWGAWRYHRLGLPAIPYCACGPGRPLPPPSPLLLGISELVVPRPGHWPGSTHLCGFWHDAGCLPAAQQHVPAAVRQLLPEAQRADAVHQGPPQRAAADARRQEAEHGGEPEQRRLICVDFGSMGRLGLIPQPSLLVAILETAAEQLARPVVLLAGGWAPLVDAWRARQQAGAERGRGSGGAARWLTLVPQPVSHDALLSLAAALVHHGGAGTLAAALRHGVPQLICPLQFDQASNADRVSWGGWGMRLPMHALFPSQAASRFGSGDGSVNSGAALQHADTQQAGQQQQQEQGPPAQLVAEGAASLATALSALLADASIRAACLQAQQQLAAEDGAGVAVAAIRQEAASAGVASALVQQRCEAPLAPAPSPPEPELRELSLPNGLAVNCVSPSETLFIFREVFQSRCYARHGLSLPPGAMVVDAGANVGLFTLFALLEWQPAAARVLAFEPVPLLAAALERNVQRHGLADRVMVVCCGLHAEEGSLPFTFYPRMPGNTTAKPTEKWEHQLPAMAAGLADAASAEAWFAGVRTLACPVTTLGAFLARQAAEEALWVEHAAQEAGEQREPPERQPRQPERQQERRACDPLRQEQGERRVPPQPPSIPTIDLLKVDVEGCELEVLQGLGDDGWAAVRQVAAEVHCMGNRLEQVVALLERRGFAVAWEQQGEVPGAAMVYARRA